MTNSFDDTPCSRRAIKPSEIRAVTNVSLCKWYIKSILQMSCDMLWLRRLVKWREIVAITNIWYPYSGQIKKSIRASRYTDGVIKTFGNILYLWIPVIPSEIRVVADDGVTSMTLVLVAHKTLLLHTWWVKKDKDRLVKKDKKKQT